MEKEEHERAEKESSEKYAKWLESTEKRERDKQVAEKRMREREQERPPWSPSGGQVSWKTIV